MSDRGQRPTLKIRKVCYPAVETAELERYRDELSAHLGFWVSNIKLAAAAGATKQYVGQVFSGQKPASPKLLQALRDFGLDEETTGSLQERPLLRETLASAGQLLQVAERVRNCLAGSDDEVRFLRMVDDGEYSRVREGIQTLLAELLEEDVEEV